MAKKKKRKPRSRAVTTILKEIEKAKNAIEKAKVAESELKALQDELAAIPQERLDREIAKAKNAMDMLSGK